ncbi:MAG: Hsp70 family protein, partial [Myxococcales bacterium]|nr:Hsp70 family protein [Myxococcales bacterium]
TDRAWDIGFGSVNAVQLSALVLSALKADAEAYLGVPVREAVITVPAYFGEHQRRATRAAAEIAGLEAERIVNEPTAAALAYGLHARDVERRVVVIDLGGGTFDVTVLEIIEGIVEIQATAGDVQLGGDDFVEAIFAAVVADDGVAPATEEVAARLREACQRLVRALSTAEQATTTAPPLPGDAGARSLTFARETAEALWEPLLARIAAIIRRALRDGAVLPGAIAEVLLVGGASRMPCLARTAHAIFGKAPNAALPPDEAVALGAAVQAALKARDASVADLVVTDIAPFTMGIATSLRQGAAYVSGLYSPILQRGTTIPASRVERYLPIAPGQRRLFVEVFQGENALCQDNAALGKVDVALPRGTVEEQAIDVRFTYDLNGIL